MLEPSLPTPGPVDQIDGTMTAAQLAATLVALLRARRHPERIQAAALARALEVAEHARTTVPFYRDAYGTSPFHGLGDVPIVDKAAMRSTDLTHRLSARPPAGCLTQRTAGTTGVPMETLYSPRFAQWLGLLRLRTDLERRSWPWWRRAYLQFGAGDQRPKRAVVRWVRRRHLALPLEADAAELAAHVAGFRARTFAGHPSRLLDIGRELPPRTRLRMLISHGESLDAPLRSSLARTYGLEPLDSYGIAEVGAVAAQCRAADLYHLHTESVVLEVVDEQDRPVGPGGTGDVLVTGLHNSLMPMVRYRVHDRVTLPDRPCACGYPGPALARIVGRSSDFAIGAAGERISPELLWLYNHLPADVIYRYVRRYQVHQVPSGEIRLRLELHEPLPDEVEAALLASYSAKAAGQPVTLHIEDDLGDRTPGKFRLVRSDAAR